MEKTQNACFGYRLGRCSGACIGKENFLKYNLRVIQAFSKSKIKIWPFDGAIVIEEKDEDSKNEYFVIDRWCFLGNFQGNDFYKPELNLKDYNFDLDTYKIISQFLRNPKNLKKVKLIKNYKSLQKQKDNFFSA
ncbi:hypothetical protein HY025_03050 [Candidatus Daviesbacteria bacterium]|nr:hypothetical protein [Candidatus Daviesbacteria bacterium]